MDFFPLTCEYIEKTYAAGKIPGGFFKREARPREQEILNARIIDRSIRPLFPDGFRNETQVIATVMSHDGVHDTDVLALSGASMALSVSHLPFALESGPIAGVRVGRIDGQLIINPTIQDREKSDIDMIVAVSADAIVMVEGGALEVPESELVEALFFAQTERQKVIKACHEMREEMGKEKMIFEGPTRDEDLYAQVKGWALAADLEKAIHIREKLSRYEGIDAAKEKTLALATDALGEEASGEKSGEIRDYFGSVKKDLMRTALSGAAL